MSLSAEVVHLLVVGRHGAFQLIGKGSGGYWEIDAAKLQHPFTKNPNIQPLITF
jgi:hypothetical protein